MLIQATNGYEELFRPYTDPSIISHDLISYKNCLNISSWSKYNPLLSDHDQTERDLYFCINRNDKDFFCGLDSGDVEQPIIKLRGNRAYICKWATHNNIKAHEELRSWGITENTDLLEVGGCLLRLAMWPTEKLFAAAEEIFLKSVIQSKSLISDIYPKFQIGVHYRCGDISFTNPFSDHACQHDQTGLDPHPEVAHMKFGTPIEVAECANQILKENDNIINLLSENYNLKSELSILNSQPTHNKPSKDFSSMVHISSDSLGSAIQINKTLNFTNNIIFPKGCHIQFNPSLACLVETSAYWLLLSLSDKIVVQTENRAPISAYSRYAAMYGLKNNSLRDSKNCSYSLSRFELSRIHQGNWFCR